MLKLLAPYVKSPVTLQNLENSNFERKNIFPNPNPTHMKPKRTTSKTTPVNSRNSHQQVISRQKKSIENTLVDKQETYSSIVLEN